MISLTPSQIIQFQYCPRFIYFEYVLRVPQYEEKYFKVNRGREVHRQKAQQNMEYTRKRLGVVRKHINQYLTNDWLRGEVDEVLELKDGYAAPLDYKFAVYKEKVYNTYKTQLYCYALLIAHNYGVLVKKGYLVYTRSKNKVVEVPIGASELEVIKQCEAEIRQILLTQRFPKGTKFKKRCLTCTYRNICVQ